MTKRGKLGVIAGAGALPVRIAAACARRGEPVFVLRLGGIADDEFEGVENATCAIGEVGKILSRLKEAGCERVVLAGIVKRPDFASLKVDWRGAKLLPKLVASARSGDGELLSTLVGTIEAEGFTVVGADEVSGDLVAPAGALGAIAPDTVDAADIAKADAVVRALGPFDVGQGAIVAGGLVLAIEAAEGTDAMLRRIAGVRPPGGARGVLVKRPKPGQERRVDLPTIGAETVRLASDAGLSGIAVEAAGALIIDVDETRAAADRLGVFVFGFDAQEVQSSTTTP